MNVLIGQYLDLPTVFHRMHPMTKLVLLIVSMTLVLMYNNIYLYGLEIIGLFLVLYLTKIPLKIIFKNLQQIRYLLLFIFVFYFLFAREGILIWQFGFIQIYDQTLIFILMLIMRLSLLMILAILLTLTTKPLDLTFAFEAILRPLGNISHIIAMILSIALRFIPTLQEEAMRIMKAQKSRGADFEGGNLFLRIKHLGSLIIPLFIISFNRAETLAMAMELRGYDPEAKRTRYVTLSFKKVDYYIIFFAFLIMMMAIAYKIFQIIN